MKTSTNRKNQSSRSPSHQADRCAWLDQLRGIGVGRSSQSKLWGRVPICPRFTSLQLSDTSNRMTSCRQFDNLHKCSTWSSRDFWSAACTRCYHGHSNLRGLSCTFKYMPLSFTIIYYLTIHYSVWQQKTTQIVDYSICSNRFFIVISVAFMSVKGQLPGFCNWWPWNKCCSRLFPLVSPLYFSNSRYTASVWSTHTTGNDDFMAKTCWSAPAVTSSTTIPATTRVVVLIWRWMYQEIKRRKPALCTV